MKVYFLYATMNIKNGMKYRGRCVAKKGSKRHKQYLGSGKILKLAIKKYGQKNFRRKIIKYFSTSKKLIIAEKFFVIIKKGFYNLKLGGEGSSAPGHTKSEITKQRMKDACKRRPPRSPEYCKAIRMAHLGKRFSVETRKKMSESRCKYWWKIKEPTGRVVQIKNIKQYCLNRKIHSSSLLRGSNSKGYKIILKILI